MRDFISFVMSRAVAKTTDSVQIQERRRWGHAKRKSKSYKDLRTLMILEDIIDYEDVCSSISCRSYVLHTAVPGPFGALSFQAPVYLPPSAKI